MDHSYLGCRRAASRAAARCSQYASPRLIHGGGIRNRRILVLRVIPYINSPLGEVPANRWASTRLNPRHIRYPSMKTARMNRYMASVLNRVTFGRYVPRTVIARMTTTDGSRYSPRLRRESM